MATATSCACTGMTVSGTGTTTGSTTISMPTICLLFWLLSSFLSRFYGRVLFLVSSRSFKILPFHPPSILPNFSISNERAIYFLLSRDLVSQSTISKTLSVSVFRMANLTQGCFSPTGKYPAMAIPSIISTNNESILTPNE